MKIAPSVYNYTDYSRRHGCENNTKFLIILIILVGMYGMGAGTFDMVMKLKNVNVTRQGL